MNRCRVRQRFKPSLLLTEGLAVGALIHSGIGLVGAYLDLIQAAVILAVTVVHALGNSTGNGLICIAVHNILLLVGDAASIPQLQLKYTKRLLPRAEAFNYNIYCSQLW